MITRRSLVNALALALPVKLLSAEAKAVDERLITALSLETVTNGVATTPAGRIFLVLTRIDGSDGPRVIEWNGGKLAPYPDLAWNSWTSGQSADGKLVRANALRIGAEGDLWLVDVGSPAIGQQKVAHGPKIVRIDLATNSVRRVYDLDSGTNSDSFIDDIRFNSAVAYITDAGSPGLIVLDLATGSTRRVLDGDRSVTAQRPLTAEGQEMHGPDGKPVFIHADQIEVSPDGTWLYYRLVPVRFTGSPRAGLRISALRRRKWHDKSTKWQRRRQLAGRRSTRRETSV
ncbi:MAG: L-dopachrome tautomerase-related protein, partial [Methylocella sp.]